MLVLSRKQNQAIQFPDLGIKVEILESTGKNVRVGVEAPVEVKIVRDELISDEARSTERTFRIPQELRHELRNELNLISLSLHVFKRKLERGLAQESDLSFEELVQRIKRISNHDSLTSHSGSDAIPDLPINTLIVEDSDNERELMSGFLELHGFDTNSVSSAEEAIDFLKDNDPPHAILLDMQLPKIQGAELLQKLRESRKFDDTFVIVVSGTTPEENNINEDDGLDAWFEKPIDPRRLIDALQQITLTRSMQAVTNPAV